VSRVTIDCIATFNFIAQLRQPVFCSLSNSIERSAHHPRAPQRHTHV